VDIKIKNITTSDIDKCVLSHKDTHVFWLPNNSILKIRRTSNQVYIATMFLTAKGRLDENTNELNIRTRLRLVYQIAFFLGLIFILSFLFARDLTINGSPDPTLSEKLIFVSVGLGIWTFLSLPLIGLKRDFNKKLRTILETKGQC